MKSLIAALVVAPIAYVVLVCLLQGAPTLTVACIVMGAACVQAARS